MLASLLPQHARLTLGALVDDVGSEHTPGKGEVDLVCRSLYLRYQLSYAEVSEWLAERGVLADQSTIYRPVIIDMIMS
jgi:hypothetical protein